MALLRPRKMNQHIAALSANLGAFAVGSMLGWQSQVINHIHQQTLYNFVIEYNELYWILSLVIFGASAACIPTGFIMERIGRRTTMLLLVIPFTIGWIVIIWARNVVMIQIGRFILGIAGGAFYVTALTYTSDIAQDSIRGTLGCYFQLMGTVGFLLTTIIRTYTTVFVLNTLCISSPLIFGGVFYFMPESPSFLVKKRKHSEAKRVLVWLRGPEYDVDCELNKLKKNAQDSNNDFVSFAETMTKKNTLRAIAICFALIFFQQFAGLNFVIYSAYEIANRSQPGHMPASYWTLLIGITSFIGTLVSTVIVDKLGRRLLLLLSTFLMCLFTTAYGVFYFMSDGHSVVLWRYPIVSLAIFIFAFFLGLGPISWIMVGELCLLETKAFFISSASLLSWLLRFALFAMFEEVTILYAQTHVIFAIINFIAFVFIFFMVPETRGKSQDDIQVLLGGQRPNRTQSENVQIPFVDQKLAS